MLWKLAAAVVVILILAAGGLAFYGAQLSPEQKTIEQVLPDERFAN